MKRIGWAIWLLLGWSAVAQAQGLEGGLFVTGEGRVAVEPDMATVSLGVTNRGATAAEAMQQNAAAVADIIAELDDLDVAPTDRQTSRFYLNPLWSNRQGGTNDAPVITGYEAGNSVTVRVRHMDRLGAVLDAVLAQGGNQFNGLSFGLQDDAPARQQARKAAVADAMARAAELAEAAGVELGAVLRIVEGGTSSPQPMMRGMAMAEAMGDAISSGEVDVTARVSVVFDIAPPR